MWIRLIALFMVFGVLGCEGTMETELDLASAALDGKADASEPVVSTRKPPTQQTPEVLPEPENEPVPEVEPVVEEPAEDPAEPGKIIEFRIEVGTSSGPWNTMETAPLVYVGQVLRIVNDDTEPHQLHVPSGGPFRHGREIPPGAQVEYLVEASWPLQERAGMYDHLHGSGAGFWLQAVE